jgi:two-component system response regulator AtoC
VSKVSVLAVLGDPAPFDGVIEWIRLRKHTVHIVLTGTTGFGHYRDHGADLVLVGLPLPDRKAKDLVKELRLQDPRVAIVLVGADASVDSPADALDLGVPDYVASATEGRNDILFALGLALGVRTGDSQLKFLRAKDAVGTEWNMFAGSSPAMQHVHSTLRMLCDRTGSGVAPIVLLTGETGTGKGVIAKSIHYNSVRRRHAFVDVNCAAIATNLLESELFGHEKGAFTDARSTKVGLFETADGGTLFLDEIGALPLDLQAKILTAIEEKKIRRVGGTQSIKIEVQIIAATHADLAAMVRRDQFRADLFHRLNVIAIEVPPLRERGDDIIHLASHLIESIAADYAVSPPVLTDEARDVMLQYSWPGNVRELRNEIERIILLVDDSKIRPRHFRFASEVRGAPETASIAATTNGLAVTLSGDRCPLDELEREVIRQAMLRCRGNVSRAARYLEITRQTLVYRLRKHGFRTYTNPDLGESDKLE